MVRGSALVTAPAPGPGLAARWTDWTDWTGLPSFSPPSSTWGKPEPSVKSVHPSKPAPNGVWSLERPADNSGAPPPISLRSIAGTRSVLPFAMERKNGTNKPTFLNALHVAMRVVPSIETACRGEVAVTSSPGATSRRRTVASSMRGH